MGEVVYALAHCLAAEAVYRNVNAAISRFKYALCQLLIRFTDVFSVR